MIEKRCVGLTAREKQCKNPVYKNGLCDSHNRMEEREKGSVKLLESNAEAVVETKLNLEKSSTTREKARERREKVFHERSKNGMLPNQKLSAPHREGFKRRWVNDDGMRVDELLDKGYSFVEDSVDGDSSILSTDQGTRKSQVVGNKKDGSPLTGYFMETEESLYQEDQQAKEDARARTEEQIRRVARNDGISRDNAYDPTEGKGQFRVET